MSSHENDKNKNAKNKCILQNRIRTKAQLAQVNKPDEVCQTVPSRVHCYHHSLDASMPHGHSSQVAGVRTSLAPSLLPISISGSLQEVNILVESCWQQMLDRSCLICSCILCFVLKMLQTNWAPNVPAADTMMLTKLLHDPRRLIDLKGGTTFHSLLSIQSIQGRFISFPCHAQVYLDPNPSLSSSKPEKHPHHSEALPSLLLTVGLTPFQFRTSAVTPLWAMRGQKMVRHYSKLADPKTKIVEMDHG